MFLYRIFVTISILVLFPVFFYSVSFDGVQLYVLPLAFTFWLLISKNVFTKYKKSIVFKIFLLTAFARYSLLPFFYYSQNSYLSLSGTTTELNLSMAIMLFELLACGLCFFYFANRQQQALNDEITPSIFFENKLTVLFALTVIVFYLLGTGVFNKVNFIWNLQEFAEAQMDGDVAEVAGYGEIMFLIFRVIIVLLLLTFVYRSKITEAVKPYLYLFIVAASSTVMIGMSRLSMLLFALPLLVLVNKIVPSNMVKRMKAINIILLMVFTILVLFSSYIKFARYNQDLQLSQVVTASSLNSYFTGVGAIAGGISSAYDSSAFKSPYFIFNDIIKNFPGLAKFSDNKYISSTSYNRDVLGHELWADKIIPLSVTGIYHFGLFGIGFYHVLFISLALLFERFSCKEHYIGYKYLYIDLSIKLSLVFMLNIGSFFAMFPRSFLFVFLPLLFIRTMRIKVGSKL